MDASRLLEVLRALCETARSAQQAIVSGDVAALPTLVERECRLGEALQALLAQVPPGQSLQAQFGGAVAREVQAQARAWRRLHEQNRLLLEHAHRTVVEWIALLSGSANEPAGLYGPAPGGDAGGLPPASWRRAVAVDRRV